MTNTPVNWPYLVLVLAVAVSGAGVAFGVLRARVNGHSKRLGKLEQHYIELLKGISRIEGYLKRKLGDE